MGADDPGDDISGRRRGRTKSDALLREGAGGDAALQERSLATREKLLDAAIAGFAREGYDGYSSRMIEQDSGVHRALIAYHFGSKLGLWKACLWSMVTDHRARLAERFNAAQDDTSRLKIWFEEFIRNASRHPEFQTMAVDAVGRDDGLFQWVLDTIGRRAHDLALDLIRSAQKAGTFVQGDPGILLNSFIGAAVRIYIMAPETENNLGRSPFDPEFVEEHVRTCIALFFRDPPAPTG